MDHYKNKSKIDSHAGNHGYSNQFPDMHSQGPAFEEGFVSVLTIRKCKYILSYVSYTGH